jgi:hypothetical protein
VFENRRLKTIFQPEFIVSRVLKTGFPGNSSAVRAIRRMLPWPATAACGHFRLPEQLF